MPSRLDDAANAFREAQAALIDARAQVGQVRADVDRARTELADAIVAAARSGMRQVEIVKRSGYTRERIRQICRAAGIEANED
jgi:F0F1-type ATP synthase membrane subunit b/b'